MGEEKYKVRALETWPCGCRVEHLRILLGDTIEWDEVERRELCRGLETLVERGEREERRVIRAYSEHGGHSPEYKRATVKRHNVLAKIEEHYNNATPTENILEVWPVHHSGLHSG